MYTQNDAVGDSVRYKVNGNALKSYIALKKWKRGLG